MNHENDAVKPTALKQIIENIVSEAPSTHTIIIREDDNLPVYQEVSTKISGILDSPARWLEKRKVNHHALSAHVIVDREKMTISLTTEERNHFNNSIKGSLEFHPAFLKFGINDGQYISPAKMADKIKMNRSFFANKSEAMALVSTLKNFKAKIDSEIEKSNDNRGNRVELLQQKVTSNMPDSFKMILPLFKGEKAKEFEVEVYINASDLECTLISPEANEEMEHLRDFAINEVIARIAAVDSEIVIIEV